jgi:hypothetical protein
MLKKALAVAFCIILAVILIAACDSGVSDEELHAEIIGVWIPVEYDLTTNEPFDAIMFTNDKHYLYSFSGGEAGNRSVTMVEGVEYKVIDRNVVVETDKLNPDKQMHQYKTHIAFSDRDNLIWGTGTAEQHYRRMTDDEIAFFGLNLGYYNKDYELNEANTTIPMTGGSTTTGGSGSNVFDGAAEKSMKPLLDYYATWDYELNPITTTAETSETTSETTAE